MCPIACTEGLVALIRHFPEGRSPAVDAVLKHCTEGLTASSALEPSSSPRSRVARTFPPTVWRPYRKGTTIGCTASNFSPRSFTPIMPWSRPKSPAVKRSVPSSFQPGCRETRLKKSAMVRVSTGSSGKWARPRCRRARSNTTAHCATPSAPRTGEWPTWWALC